MLLVHADGAWWAIEDRCSHADCAFSSDGEVVETTAICDCHGSEFDIRTGEVLVPPAKEPIAVFPVRVNAGQIEVEVP